MPQEPTVLAVVAGMSGDIEEPRMPAAHPVSALMFITFGIVLALLIGGWLMFMRKPHNRNAGERMPERGEPGAPDKPRGASLTSGEVGRSERTAKR